MLIPFGSRRSPLGCVVGFFGIAGLVYAGFSWWGYSKAQKMTDTEKGAEYAEFFSTMGWGSLVVGLAVLLVAWLMMNRS